MATFTIIRIENEATAWQATHCCASRFWSERSHSLGSCLQRLHWEDGFCSMGAECSVWSNVHETLMAHHTQRPHIPNARVLWYLSMVCDLNGLRFIVPARAPEEKFTSESRRSVLSRLRIDYTKALLKFTSNIRITVPVVCESLDQECWERYA